ncbi:hypothetical protein B0H14DRAFT_2590317 [Mycena olivaceomarginata]|nr:hypothetical protein B0H14DRAFT_2590317 [Mycena olivaceomarginata]
MGAAIALACALSKSLQLFSYLCGKHKKKLGRLMDIESKGNVSKRRGVTFGEVGDGYTAAVNGVTFWNYCQSSKCEIQCDGVPLLVRPTHASSAYGKQYFIGCSKWKRSETGSNLYRPIPPNVDEDVLRFVMENEGRLPTGPAEMNNHCVLTVHPRVGLTRCSYSHIINGKIKPAGIEHRLCPSRTIIYVPVEDSPAPRHKVIVVLENPHNNPIHPTSKPSTEDKLKLKTAVNALGKYTAPYTLSVYNGKSVADSSPAFGLGIDFGSKLVLCYLYDILALTSQVEGVEGVHLSWDEADLFGFAGLAGHDWPFISSL